jgi:hypothetical protein
MGFQLESLFAMWGFPLESRFAMMGFQLESMLFCYDDGFSTRKSFCYDGFSASLFCYDGFSARESVLL